MRTRLLHAVQSLQRGLDVLADYLGAEPAMRRPKVGPWVDTGYSSLTVYDDRGSQVAGVSGEADQWHWSARQAHGPVVFGYGEPTKEAARSKAVAVLSTWADCSAIQGREAGE
jgi:hypothetical protein